MTQFFCQRCGMVHEEERPLWSGPWCRHGDISFPANRMVPLPTWHPMHVEAA